MFDRRVPRRQSRHLGHLGRRIAAVVIAMALPMPTLAQPTIDPNADPDRPAMRAAEGLMCEWSPHREQQPAASDCGYNDIAVPKVGLFDCGKVSNGKKCVDYCKFVKCYNP